MMDEPFSQETRELYRKCLDKWGPVAQFFMVYEEIGELMQAISKWDRKPSRENQSALTEEIADVLIMLEQLEVLVSIPYGRVSAAKEAKLMRLREIVEAKQDCQA